ncbi:hypothetical protein [Dyadobacter diqingensis]|uniref:hypothetical protein n=1 Tax=Dyadobacter diqingensis TaxID=2938121 RepID=UPI0020C1B2BC|nr:hypothetical protein [Dyadobacter diqingensis]
MITEPKKYKVGMLLFPGLTIQDFVGPYDVFIRADCFEVLIVSENTDLLQAEGGLTLKADYTFENCVTKSDFFIYHLDAVQRTIQNRLDLSNR